MATTAVRETFLSYCQPSIGEEEIAEVVDSLRSGWITTGPKTQRFEEELAGYVGARHAIALSSCTAALHAVLAAHDIGPGDEVVVPTLTFCATANVVAQLGAKPTLVDVNQDFQIDVDAVQKALTGQTKAIIAVHYGGQACDLTEILDLAASRGIPVIEDAAHAIGTEYRGQKIGAHGRAVAFSFYPTKNMTTGEGGALTTDDDALAKRVRLLSLHGMSHDAWQRYSEKGSWYYEVVEPGFKYNFTDIQAALGIHQLRRLDQFIARRQQIARMYREGFAGVPELILPRELPGRNHVYHLFTVRLKPEGLRVDRAGLLQKLREAGIGSSVHFIPLHRHPFYQQTYGYGPEQFPQCERLYEGLFSLPLYPKMTDGDVSDVVEIVLDIIKANRK